MLRVTVQEDQGVLTFKLEGRLAGPWVREVEDCRQRSISGREQLPFFFDLTGVTFIDPGGMAFLTAMHRRGAHFVTADCLTRAAVAEIAAGAGHGKG